MGVFLRIEPMDLVVYGQVQNAYVEVSDPATRLGYPEAVVKSALRRAVSVEIEEEPMVTAARQRQRKLERLGEALADVSSAFGQCQVDANKAGESYLTYDKTYSIGSAATILPEYGVSCSAMMNGADLSKLQQSVKLELDKENSSLQQTTSSLQSFMSKCNSAYSTIGTLQRKMDGTASRTLSAMQG